MLESEVARGARRLCWRDVSVPARHVLLGFARCLSHEIGVTSRRPPLSCVG